MLFGRFWGPKNGRKIDHLLGVFDDFRGVFLGPFWGFLRGGCSLGAVNFSRYTKSQPFKGVRAVHVAVHLGGFK